MSHDKAAVKAVLQRVRKAGRTALSAPESKKICDAYGIPVPKERLVKSAKDAAAAAKRIGFPVVLKIVSKDILHKTEAGGVLVGLDSAGEVEKGYRTILKNDTAYDKDADVARVQVQQENGRETSRGRQRKYV